MDGLLEDRGVVLDSGQPVPRRSRACGFRNFALSCESLWSLTRAIDIGGFGEGVKSNLPGGQRQIDAVSHQLICDVAREAIAGTSLTSERQAGATH